MDGLLVCVLICKGAQFTVCVAQPFSSGARPGDIALIVPLPLSLSHLFSDDF